MPEHLIPVAITGLGRGGWGIHAKTLRTMPEKFVITAVADPDPSRRAEAAGELGCATWESLEPMLEAGGFRVLVVASPDARHAPDAIAALETGYDVVVEKPFAVSTEQAENVIATANKHKRLVAPFEHRRDEPHSQEVREVVRNGPDDPNMEECHTRFYQDFHNSLVRGKPLIV